MVEKGMYVCLVILNIAYNLNALWVQLWVVGSLLAKLLFAYNDKWWLKATWSWCEPLTLNLVPTLFVVLPRLLYIWCIYINYNVSFYALSIEIVTFSECSFNHMLLFVLCTDPATGSVCAQEGGFEHQPGSSQVPHRHWLLSGAPQGWCCGPLQDLGRSRPTVSVNIF